MSILPNCKLVAKFIRCTLVLGFCLCTFYFSLSFSQVTELWRFPTPLLPLSLSAPSTANQHIQILQTVTPGPTSSLATWLTRKNEKVQFLSMPSPCSLILNNHFKATLTALSLSSLLMSHERCCSSEVLKCIIEMIWRGARRRWPHFGRVNLGYGWVHTAHIHSCNQYLNLQMSLWLNSQSNY